tara:strand:- start:1291 stop:1857 length:567 start_codon:yes stop_codon:yes gene_type:complete
MTDYTSIADSQVEPLSPVTSELMTALRDNPRAIAEGAVGAPKIQGAAAADEGRGLPVITVTAADTVTVVRGAGAVTGNLTTSSAVDVVAQTYTIFSYTGSMRFTASHQAADVYSTSVLSLYKNDVLVNSWSTTNLAQRTEDVSVAPTDVIEWRHRSPSASALSSFSGAVLRASDGYVLQNLYARFSDL